MVERRNFRLNPVTHEELMECYWYAVPNDLIGGYTVATVDKPDSLHNVYEGDFEIGTFMTLETAQHIAELHNAWWNIQIEDSYAENIMATYNRELEEGYAQLVIDKGENPS